jgi:hypothetical protein
MIVLFFTSKLGIKQRDFWTKYIYNQECEIQEVNLNIKDNIKFIIKLSNETFPIKSFVSLKNYLNSLKKSVLIKDNDIFDSFGIYLKEDFQNISNNSNIKDKTVINYNDESSILYTSFKKLMKKTIEDYLKNIDKAKLEELNSKNYFFVRRVDEQTEYNNKKFIDYLKEVTDSYKGINRLDKIYIINLEHRKDRLQSIMTQLNKLGVNNNIVQRINAVYYKEFGAIGCGLSHVLALEEAEKGNYENVLIFEDDYILNVDANVYNNNIEKLYLEKKTWDVVMVGANLENYKDCEHKFLIKINKARTTSGYIINKTMYKKVKDNFKEACELMEKHKNTTDDRIVKHNFAIDMYWQKLQPDHEWYCFKERLGIQLPCYSDVENRFTQYGV